MVGDLVRNIVKIPYGLIVFISGVPGVGKTTISYELLKAFNEFRIIEETDLIREVLRGYNDFIRSELSKDAQLILEKIEIYDHTKFLSFDDAKQQCRLMKNSFEKIVERQQRKGIPTIINGVHIVPEILNGLARNQNIIYINLFVNSEREIYNRLKGRNPDKYRESVIPLIYRTNMEMYLSTLNLADSIDGHIFNNIDVTTATIPEALSEITKCIIKKLKMDIKI